MSKRSVEPPIAARLDHALVEVGAVAEPEDLFPVGLRFDDAIVDPVEQFQSTGAPNCSSL